MDDGRTEPFEPYQPETSYDWDYEEEPPRPGAPKILWGRVVAVVVVLLLAFLLGRATAGGGGGVSEERFSELQDENRQLEQQLSEALAENNDQTETPPPADGEETPPPADGESKIYVVKEGDTLRGIAEKFYGDAALDDVIADANGIDDPLDLHVGDELIIPPEPEE